MHNVYVCVCVCVRSQDGSADQVLPSGSPASLSTLLAESDFLVLTCPLSDETEGLIGTAELQAMKPSATLVNCARGAVVVEDELIAALKAGDEPGLKLAVRADVIQGLRMLSN